MTGVEFGFVMFGVMLVLLAIRVPIGVAMLLTGVAGAAPVDAQTIGEAEVIAHVRSAARPEGAAAEAARQLARRLDVTVLLTKPDAVPPPGVILRR